MGRKARTRDEEEPRDDVSIPLEEPAFKKKESRGREILIRTFRADRPNLLMLFPPGPIYKCKIAYVPLSLFLFEVLSLTRARIPTPFSFRTEIVGNKRISVKRKRYVKAKRYRNNMV